MPPSELEARLLRKQALEKLIDHLLVYQKAQQQGIQLTSADITNGLDMVMSRFSPPISMEQYLQREGLTRQQFMTILRRQLLVHKYMLSLSQHIQIDRNTLLAYYKRQMSSDVVIARHIVIPVEANEAQAREQANNILTEARTSGANFAVLAQRYSKDPSAKQGGSIGEIKRGDLIPTLEDVLFALPQGGVGGPVRTDLGYHILKVDHRRAAVPFVSVQMEIAKMLQMQQIEQILKKQIAELREDAQIEILVTWAKD
jgi:parvulin-like peptidyl-prolyl isomerase